MSSGPGRLKQVAAWLPHPAIRFLRAIRYAARGAWYQGTERWCPVCEYYARTFLSFNGRPDAECPRCGSLERHRLVWEYFRARTDLFDGKPKRVLHVAPELAFEPRLRQQLGAGYLTADLLDRHVAVRMDITHIQFADETFDVIYCSHVLEHVPDDRKAMREFYRVLKPTGWGVLLVPIIGDRTIEDPTVTDPKERLRLFGQEDHVRHYGADYPDRLREAGFDVTMTTISDLLPKPEAIRRGIGGGEAIYHCRRARPSSAAATL